MVDNIITNICLRLIRNLCRSRFFLYIFFSLLLFENRFFSPAFAETTVESSKSILVAAKSKKKRQSHARPSTQPPRKKASNQDSIHSFRLYAGPFLGVEDIKGAVTYGFDYGIKKYGLQFLIGAGVWQHTHHDIWTDVAVDTKVNYYGLDAGLGYPFYLSENFYTEFGGRIGYAGIRIASKFITDKGSPEVIEGTTFSFISPFFSLRFQQNKTFSYGIEYRKPIFFDEDIKKFSGYHIYLHFGVGL